MSELTAYEKSIIEEQNFRAIDINTKKTLSCEERDSYLSMIKRFPFIVNNGYMLVKMNLKKGEDIVSFEGNIGRNDGVVGYVSGNIDFVLNDVSMDISLSNGEKYDLVTAKFDVLGNVDGKVIK